MTGDGESRGGSDVVYGYKRGVAEPGDYDVDDDSNDKARDVQVIGDRESSGESDDVHDYKREGAEP